MTNTWAIVADSARARVLVQPTKRAAWVERKDLVHLQGKQRDHELVSDRQGRTADSSRTGARHAMEPQTMPKEIAVNEFARTIATQLESARTRSEIDELVLIAPAHFLGVLNAHLSDPLRQLVRGQLHKNLVRRGIGEITEHLASMTTATN